MKAVLDGVVIAEADREDLISIEGNWYFPPSSIREGALTKTPTPYTCPWKGAAQYWSIALEGAELTDGAWSYPDLLPGAVEKAGGDFAGFVAFDRKVSVQD
ncbi:DUF427 domain-containing protein [Microbacterium hatanonis]|jgi:uncharacterized protein (DUF427 family)|uniref:DUF427 domain-containing protein n=1 Tax=Microbacterium hatanonis TaxID=404366 RepID=A0A5C8I4D2_9MICO|nr:DUF427 domain-containing protein [Microbacterium hatanonis]TXK13536.1 DUF427 domain-containing protein [Microbacterium hatanonis]